MKNKNEFGKWGEDVAVEYLKKKGFTLLYRNWRAERGEIDIIARDGGYVVFVEVKTGSSEKYGPPELRLTPGKKRQLIKVASLFICQAEEKREDCEGYRFDVVVVDGHRQKYQVRHYENAFGA